MYLISAERQKEKTIFREKACIVSDILSLTDAACVGTKCA
jgi:hypothetical protein